ncbi:MAG TPA: hypothetical protein VKC55_05105 [Actinomycetota bacterium]|nr:hypothetical protein [Actinomycetota bacterium]
MRAELFRADDPQALVAVATWSKGRPRLEVLDPSVEGLDGLLRPTPVVVDDPSLRGPGTSGESLLEPGSLEWLRAALATRAEPLGLRLRFVTTQIEGGWDPAANDRTFDQQVERLASS